MAGLNCFFLLTACWDQNDSQRLAPFPCSEYDWKIWESTCSHWPLDRPFVSQKEVTHCEVNFSSHCPFPFPGLYCRRVYQISSHFCIKVMVLCFFYFEWDSWSDDGLNRSSKLVTIISHWWWCCMMVYSVNIEIDLHNGDVSLNNVKKNELKASTRIMMWNCCLVDFLKTFIQNWNCGVALLTLRMELGSISVEGLNGFRT
jgi:hypothetical protein